MGNRYLNMVEISSYQSLDLGKEPFNRYLNVSDTAFRYRILVPA